MMKSVFINLYEQVILMIAKSLKIAFKKLCKISFKKSGEPKLRNSCPIKIAVEAKRTLAKNETILVV